MRIHLLTYATPRFRLRQWILGTSARLNGVVDTVTSWTPDMLLAAGFEERCKGIKLSERGSGFWAWKPFIIAAKLREVQEGDVVFYCDVGRSYPFKTIGRAITPYLEWMHSEAQFIMPGVHIPWKGPMSMWTKRAAFHVTGLDNEAAHRSAPIQASFSFWIVGEASRQLCKEWLELCLQGFLINDDRSPPPLHELPDYFEHRHDQSLLSLCCLKSGIHGIDIGGKMPATDTQHPDEILDLLGHSRQKIPLKGRILRKLVSIFAFTERMIRTYIKFGEDRPPPVSEQKSKRRHHPNDPHISNGKLALWLIALSRKRIPGLFRFYSAYLNCDLGIALPETVFLPHPFGIVVSSGVEFGEDVVIGHQVTIGNRGGVMAAPKIGHRVYIGAGAKILGPLTIGDDAVVGANAVVTKDVPAGATVVGANRILNVKF